MLKINTDALQSGDWLHGRNENSEGRTIRFALMSWGNHDGMFINHKGIWRVMEAVPPYSKFTLISDYEQLINAGYTVRVFRLKNATHEQRALMAEYFEANLLDLRYPPKWKILILGSRLINVFSQTTILKIKNWCTQLCWKACVAIIPDILDGPNGKKKEQPTPKTTENRVIQGLFYDVTDQVIINQTS